LKENADKIPAEVKSEVESKMEAVKTAAKGSDVSALRRAMDDFNESLQKVGQHIYGAGAGASGSGSGDGTGAESGSGDESGEGEVVDAEYKEV
jgi:molecular chaperone DnaK